MAEADSHLKLFPVSILDVTKALEQIDLLHMGIWQQPQTVTPTLLGSILIFWVTYGVNMMSY
jgi:hypothetical protein